MGGIGIGFVGLGGICRQRHAPGLSKIEGVKFVAVANRSRESSEAAAREFCIPTVCDSWKDLLAMREVDAVFIGTWPYMHHPISIAALEAGKHVFCQARMAMNYQEAVEMRDIARLYTLVNALCPVPFGLSIDRAIARLINNDLLGDVRLVRVTSLSNAYVEHTAPMNWRKDHRLSGLNMLTMGMYIEVMHRWFGNTREVTAQTHIYTPLRMDGLGQPTEVKVPDQVVFNTVMDNGVMAQYAISGMSSYPMDTIDIFGTKAALHYDVPTDRLYNMLPNGAREPVAIAPGDYYDAANWRVEQDFIDAIRNGAHYHPNFDDGARYMQVVQAVHDSAAKQQTIHLKNE